MDHRFIIGLAALAATTSCVAPGAETTSTARPAIASPRHVAARILPVAPAGPPPMLLAPAPEATDAYTLSKTPPFVGAAQPDDARRALDCLTAAVYYEARSEPVEGQEAVAQVVLNRVRNPAFPNTVCGTVYEGSSRETGCQFTFTCDGSLAARREPAAWERARRVAAAALAGNVYAPIGTATYYHTTAILPWWAPSLTRVATIGAHIFYRLHGAWGGALAFHQHYAGIEPAAAIGMRYPEKGAAQVVDAIEAGVTVHRGASDHHGGNGDDDKAIVEQLGIHIHRGSDPSTATTAGVVVHEASAAALPTAA